MKRTLIAMVLLTNALTGQGVAWWRGTWEGATEDARRRNVPLLVAFVMDGEEANDRIVAGLYKEDAFIQASRRTVAVLACPNTHKPVEAKVDGKSVRVCSKFGHVKCEDHKNLEMEVRLTFWPDGRVATPTHCVVLADETKIRVISDVMPTGSYLDAIKDARSKLGGRGLTRAEYAEVLSLIGRAKVAMNADDYIGSGKALAEADRMAQGTPLASETGAVRAALMTKGEELALRAAAAAEAGDVLGALRLLRSGVVAFRGTELARALRKAESKLSRTKAGRAAAKLIKAEDRARPSFDKAKGYERGREYVKAVKAYYRVISLAAGSPLAGQARERLAALSADADIAPLVSKQAASEEAELELKAARTLLRQRKKEAARAALERIVKQWPKTGAAAKARKLLGSDG